MVSPNKGGIGLWFVLILAIFLGWVGFRIGRLYLDHRTLKNEVSAIAERALVDRSYDVRTQILKLFEMYGVRLDPETIQLEFNPVRDRVTVSFGYSRSADLMVAFPSFPFQIDVQREALKAVGIVQGFRQGVEAANDASARKYQQEVKKSLGTGE